MSDKKHKSFIKYIHFVNDDGLLYQKAFGKIKNIYHQVFMNDDEFINYSAIFLSLLVALS